MSHPSPAAKKPTAPPVSNEHVGVICKTTHNSEGSEPQEWFLRVVQQAETLSQIRETLGDHSGLDLMVEKAENGCLKDRTRALVVLAKLRRIPHRVIARLLHISRTTIDKCFRRYRQHGADSLFSCKASSRRVEASDQIPQTVQLLLLSTPRAFGIDQPTWRGN